MNLSMRMLLSLGMISLLCTSIYSEDSEVSRRKDVLNFGLEGEIIQLIQQIMDEKTSDYDKELFDLFNASKSSPVRESILGLFAAQKKDSLKEFSLELLTDPYDSKMSLVSAVLEYVSVMKFAEAAPSVRAILASENTEYRDRAIRTLGKIGSPEDAVFLFEYLESEISGDEKQRLIIRQNVMSALGELKAVETWDKMAEILKDEDENTIIRATAAAALGKMGREEAIPLLIELYENTDPILRTSAIQGLSGFKNDEAMSIILEGFKDSYYKVRLESIAASETLRLEKAVPYLIYRAKTDPVDEVKYRAFTALGTFNDAEAKKWLNSLITNDKTPDKMRVKAAAVLIENDPSFVYSDIEKLMLSTLKDDKKTWLRYELAKLAIKFGESRTDTVAAAFLIHKDTVTRSLGIDMYSKNRALSLRSEVEKIAADEKQGALQRHAKKILDE